MPPQMHVPPTAVYQGAPGGPDGYWVPSGGYGPAPPAPGQRMPALYAAAPTPPDLTSAESKSLMTKLEVSNIPTWVDLFGSTLEGKFPPVAVLLDVVGLSPARLMALEVAQPHVRAWDAWLARQLRTCLDKTSMEVQAFHDASSKDPGLMRSGVRSITTREPGVRSWQPLA